MRVSDKYQVFNLMNTNGRRSDVINAYTIYMEILNELYEESGELDFERYPYSLKQFEFYKRAIERSPEVFKQHPKFDNFIKELNNNEELARAFQERDIEKIENLPKGESLLKVLDNGIEDRARHYTSNLVKLGFVDQKRVITPVGKTFVENRKVTRSEFENLLPIDDTNLIFLRQLLKLRVYTSEKTFFYNPMLLCIYILLEVPRVSESDLRGLVQMINPYIPVDVEKFITDFEQTSMEEIESRYIDFSEDGEYKNVKNQIVPMEKTYFEKIFKNRKSGKVPEYYDFYESLVIFLEDMSSENLDDLYKVFYSAKEKINKAFGYGKDVLNFSNYKNLNKFIDDNNDSVYFQSKNINTTIYSEFNGSKRHDTIQEYGDTFTRIIKATGIVSFKNGIAQLKYKGLWEEFFKEVALEENIFMKSSVEEYTTYEENLLSDFFKNISVDAIFDITKNNQEITIQNTVEKLGVSSKKEVKEKLVNMVNDEFEKFIKEKYPKEKVIEILSMFSDRTNDKKIKEETESSASVPTIFEYITGIAWYYISDRKYDLFSSFKLSMNADFIPETHAGGGDGDIIAVYEDEIVMLEVTLMNKQAQKRGEWEPVLRHATNLTIDESPKQVTTIFVADELDANTINIWRAVATVPLISSREVENEGKFAENVKIMPIKNLELVNILENNVNATSIIKEIGDSFDKLEMNFDLGWRENIMSQLS
ncbi:AlwI family type II restriction endonuclease [Vagococcus fluvialis]|uniref:AlwI family type II restriction endonuclease n=1 Tax=Vagococcus fluvialis TaxID=2738 RepID=UPI001A8C850B|nr:AlwI family type II restriction endonuclease [Vagococcus fluvialis]MBO0436211.1 AlwI family type II restriction endonuclease [Vagococcus fluvialis]